jgi:hypothetical protein
MFITPQEFQGSAMLSASTGLQVVEAGLWRFSQAGYNDSATFGLTLTHPSPLESGLLNLQAVNWPIAVIGNDLTAYTDPDSGVTYSADQCRITVTGAWWVQRQVNSNSYNSFGVDHSGVTDTDLGTRSMGPWLLNFRSRSATYVRQGSAVSGGAQDTFSNHVFFCRITETASSDNSNRQFQSNTVARPVWAYTFSKSWQIVI